jgi:hypothetical protein
MLGFRFNRALLSDAAAEQFAAQYLRILGILTKIPGGAGPLNSDWSDPASTVVGPVGERS